MLNVAFVAAVLPFTVSIRPEFFTAVRAGEIVVGFPIYHVHMLLPPVIAAGIAAEQLFLTLWLLLDFRTAVLAQHIFVFFVRDSRQRFALSPKTVAAAEGFNRFQLYPRPLGYLPIAQSLHSQFPDHFFFVICHHIRFLSLDSILANGTWTFCRQATLSVMSCRALQ